MVIPETQSLASGSSTSVAQEAIASNDSGHCSQVYGGRWVDKILAANKPFFRPQTVETSSDESEDDGSRIVRQASNGVTCVPESPDLSEADSVASGKPFNRKPFGDQRNTVDENHVGPDEVFEGIVVGSPEACVCQENEDDFSDEDPGNESIPDEGAHLYQDLPENVPDEGVQLEQQPVNEDDDLLNNGPPDDDPDPDDGPFGDPEEPEFNPNGNHNVLNAYVQDRLIQCFSQKFAARRAEVLAGHYIAEGFYAFIVENRQLIYNILRFPKCYKTVRRRADKRLPPITMDFLIRNLDNNEEFWDAGDKFNAKDYGNPLEFHVVETWTRIRLADVLEMTDEWHYREYEMHDQVPPWRDPNGDPVRIDISWDGVALDRKNDQVLEVFSMRLVDCNRIIPLGMTQSLGKCSRFVDLTSLSNLHRR